MTKNNTSIILVSVVMLTTGAVIMLVKKNSNTTGSDRLPVVLHSFKVNDGWGYELVINNKVYIHQEYIPAIPSYKRFTTEAEALQTGNLVIDKLKRGHKPSVTVQEIDSLHIHY